MSAKPKKPLQHRGKPKVTVASLVAEKKAALAEAQQLRVDVKRHIDMHAQTVKRLIDMQTIARKMADIINDLIPNVKGVVVALGPLDKKGTSLAALQAMHACLERCLPISIQVREMCQKPLHTV